MNRRTFLLSAAAAPVALIPQTVEGAEPIAGVLDVAAEGELTVTWKSPGSWQCMWLTPCDVSERADALIAALPEFVDEINAASGARA